MKPTVVSARPDLLADQDLPPQPMQKRSLDKRVRLKEAGHYLFGKNGYEGTSIDQIAGHAMLAVGGFYQHYRSKRQLLLALMDELLDGLSRVNLGPPAMEDPRTGLHHILSRAFSADLKYLGAYRAWQEAILSDPELARNQVEIQAWTTARVLRLFQFLQQQPKARPDVDLPGLAHAMDSFFWNLLGQALRLSKVELNRWIDTSVHLIYHAMFLDADSKR